MRPTLAAAGIEDLRLAWECRTTTGSGEVVVVDDVAGAVGLILLGQAGWRGAVELVPAGPSESALLRMRGDELVRTRRGGAASGRRAERPARAGRTARDRQACRAAGRRDRGGPRRPRPTGACSACGFSRRVWPRRSRSARGDRGRSCSVGSPATPLRGPCTPSVRPSVPGTRPSRGDGPDSRRRRADGDRQVRPRRRAGRSGWAVRWSTPTPCSCTAAWTSARRSCRRRSGAGRAPPARRARRDRGGRRSPGYQTARAGRRRGRARAGGACRRGRRVRPVRAGPARSAGDPADRPRRPRRLEERGRSREGPARCTTRSRRRPEGRRADRPDERAGVWCARWRWSS